MASGYATNILSAVQITPSGEISVLQSEVTGGYMFLTTQEEPRHMNWERQQAMPVQNNHRSQKS